MNEKRMRATWSSTNARSSSGVTSGSTSIMRATLVTTRRSADDTDLVSIMVT